MRLSNALSITSIGALPRKATGKNNTCANAKSCTANLNNVNQRGVNGNRVRHTPKEGKAKQSKGQQRTARNQDSKG